MFCRRIDHVPNERMNDTSYKYTCTHPGDESIQLLNKYTSRTLREMRRKTATRIYIKISVIDLYHCYYHDYYYYFDVT